MKKFFTVLVIFITQIAQAQETVADFDGNIYNTVTIGNQVWLKENLKSLHYSDGEAIPDVVKYNDSDSLGEIYGCLYTWDAAMRNSTSQGAQGIAPEGWHIPTDAEWKEMENYLGGASVAGGKMKTAGTSQWNSPNTAATNSSGFSALPAGEYDGFYTPHIFRLLNEYAVFWTSTQVTLTKARERYLSYESEESSIYDWYKVMKYSIRCIKDAPTSLDDNIFIPEESGLEQNYPNPFNPSTKIKFSVGQICNLSCTGIHTTLKIYNSLGAEITTLVNEIKSPGTYEVEWDASGFASGIYLCKMECGNFRTSKKMILLR